MGIKGLLKGLHFATKKSNIREFRGCRLGIDFSCWVHRSVYSVAMSFVEASENNQITKNCVAVSSNYVIKRCQELLENFHVSEVVLVLDGTRIPLKHGEAKERERKQQANLREAREHKRNGRLDKAEEKYKMCIKIKNEFTEAVIMEVLKAFKGDNRVKVVWSPYEADAQLAKLCMDQLVDAVISEDSDLAVYSVTTKVAFPVIFKLDRTTGACDVISMSWLLEPSPTQQMAKAKSVLEGLLLNFASRELKRPGFGARLFVQGCVLAGCDYAANSLPGVGLVNAFKLVRDNSYRNDSVRFKKILDSLPRKVKSTIDIADYESNLAKSEAVFYYHVVLHTTGHYKHITEPRFSDEKGAEHRATDHSPLLSRFKDELNFLGEADTSGLQPKRPVMPQQLDSSTNCKSLFQKVPDRPLQQWVRPVQKMKNPYSKSKELGAGVGQIVQAAESANAKNSIFKILHNRNEENSNIRKCHQLPDVRYAKRHFPEDIKRCSNTNPQSEENSHSCERNFERLITTNLANSFDYSDDKDSETVSLLHSTTNIGNGETRGNGKAGNSPELISHSEKQSGAVNLVNSSRFVKNNHSQQEEYISDLGDSDFSPPSCTIREGKVDDEAVVPSRFFRKKSVRRITLEPNDIETVQKRKTSKFEPGLQERKRQKTCHASLQSSRRSCDSSLDEVVDSPPALESIARRQRSIQTSGFKVGSRLGAPQPRGTIEAGFAKQRQLSSLSAVAGAERKLWSSRVRGTKIDWS